MQFYYRLPAAPSVAGNLYKMAKSELCLYKTKNSPKSAFRVVFCLLMLNMKGLSEVQVNQRQRTLQIETVIFL